MVKDILYSKIKDYVYNTDDVGLDEDYTWYNVQVGDKEDLINIMYESYLNNYNENELKDIIKHWED